MPPTHGLFEWSWHHFRPLAQETNFLPILDVLGDHDGELVEAARDNVNREVDALNLGVGIGKRDGEPYADIFRDRIDVWRFTGAICEPGLVDDEIRLTDLGQALLGGVVTFQEAMARQAMRLRFPRVRVRRGNGLGGAVDQLKDALEVGSGVRVVEAWALAIAYLRERGAQPAISGEEAARFLSGCASTEQVPERAEAIIAHRANQPTPDFPAVSNDKLRQGRELATWLIEHGALVLLADAPLFIDDPPNAQGFQFARGNSEEIRAWQEWWGSAP